MNASRCFFLSLLLLSACGDDETATGGGNTSQGGQGGVSDGGAGGAGGGGDGGGGSGGEGGSGGSCDNDLPNLTAPPATLSETGLYDDIGAKVISSYAQPYTPQFELWSDGAVKSRWVYLPECDIIDNSDEDNWDFPVGARFWKEFQVNGTLVETRFIHRFGPNPNDFIFASYQWNQTDEEATLVDPIAGQLDAKGTTHDIPTEDECRRCHGPHNMKGGTPSRILGFGAVQLSHDGSGLTMASLSNDGLLTAPNAAGYAVPGTPTEQAALGYLHANCGNCHNDTANGLLFPFFDARIKAGDLTVAETSAYDTLVNDTTDFYVGYGCSHRIAGMDVTQSCVHQRMSIRGDDTTPDDRQMPPLGTDEPDTIGLGIIEAWIGILPPP